VVASFVAAIAIAVWQVVLLLGTAGDVGAAGDVGGAYWCSGARVLECLLSIINVCVCIFELSKF